MKPPPHPEGETPLSTNQLKIFTWRLFFMDDKNNLVTFLNNMQLLFRYLQLQDFFNSVQVLVIDHSRSHVKTIRTIYILASLENSFQTALKQFDITSMQPCCQFHLHLNICYCLASNKKYQSYAYRSRSASNLINQSIHPRPRPTTLEKTSKSSDFEISCKV